MSESEIKNDLKDSPTVVDTLFMKTGYARDKATYASKSFLKSSPLVHDTLKPVEEQFDVAIRYFADQYQLDVYLHKLLALHSTLIASFNQRKHFVNDVNLRRHNHRTHEFVDTSSTTKLQDNYNSSKKQPKVVVKRKKSKTWKEEDEIQISGPSMWTQLLPVAGLGPYESKSSQNLAEKTQRVLLRKTIKRMLNGEQPEPRRLLPGPMVVKFIVQTEWGEMNFEEKLKFLHIDSTTHTDLDGVKNIALALKFLDQYGTDFLQCEFFRHRIFYKACQVTPFEETKNNTSGIGVVEQKKSPLSYAELRNLALTVLGGASLPAFDEKYPSKGVCMRVINFREYELKICSGSVVLPFFEPVNGEFKWIPIWYVAKRYWELDPRSVIAQHMGHRPWKLLHDAWLFRALAADARLYYYEEFCRRHSKISMAGAFNFMTYWNDCIRAEVRKSLIERHAEWTGGRTDLSESIRHELERVYEQEVVFMDMIYRSRWIYLGKESHLREKLAQIERHNRLVVLFYTLANRIAYPRLFFKLFESANIFIKSCNSLTKRGEKLPFTGMLVDIAAHPYVHQLLPSLAHNVFTLDGDSFAFEHKENCARTIRYSGLNLLSLNTCKLAFDYRRLDVSFNLITYFNKITDSSYFGKLIELDLSGNRLEYFNESPFRELVKLEKLNLSRNSIRLIPRYFFQGLQSLKVLDVSENQISLIDNHELSSLARLVSLRLDGNHFRDLDLNEFNSMTNLITLDLSSNRLERLNNSLTLKKLSRLYLNDNCLETIELGLFKQLDALELLNLGHNLIGSIPDQTFTNMPSLECLFLNSNRISWIAESAFLFCNRLKFVSLACNRLASIESNVFLKQMLVNPDAIEEGEKTKLYYQLKSGADVLDESPLRALLLFDNLLDKNGENSAWRSRSVLFRSSQFSRLRYLMLSWDADKAAKLVDSKHFVKFRDTIRYEMSRYMLERFKSNMGKTSN